MSIPTSNDGQGKRFGPSTVIYDVERSASDPLAPENDDLAPPRSRRDSAQETELASATIQLLPSTAVSDDIDGSQYRIERGTGQWGILLAYLVSTSLFPMD